MNRSRQILSSFIMAAAVLLFVVNVARNPDGPLPALVSTDSPLLTPQAQQHLLYGDKRGGGHLHGVGKECKSEFPAHWDKEEVITRVKTVAANDNLNWKQQDNGYYVAEQNVEGIRVRVVLNGDRTKIITAYPTNVPRNPCPARRPANDNANDN